MLKIISRVVLRLRKYYQSEARIKKVLTEDKYIANYDINLLTEEVKSLIKIQPIHIIASFFHPRYFCIPIKFKIVINNLPKNVRAHNEKFIEAELLKNKKYFDSLFEEYKIDDQQRKAIIADEDNNLVIAGAGTGKTTIVAGKIKYLIEKKKILYKDILALAFTRDAAESLRQKIGANEKDIENPCSTFHSFGLKILRDVEGESVKGKLLEEEGVKKLIGEIFTKLKSDSKNGKYLLDYFINDQMYKSQFEFETLGKYTQFIKDQNYTFLKKDVSPHYFSNDKDTYRHEVVKSIEECIIANFLFINRVDYEYEKIYPYMYGTGEYKPDFTITQGDKEYYLEHFAISRHNEVPPFFKSPNQSYEAARDRYLKQMEWKRNLHATNDTQLIETYSYEFVEGSFINKFEKKLIDAGIKLNPMTPKELWEFIIENNNQYKKNFIELMSTAISLYKSNLLKIDYLTEKNELINDLNLKERNRKLIHLFKLVYEEYEKALEIQKNIDFHDMINRATTYLEKGLSTRSYKYIFIDEFQDLSMGRYRLIQALRGINPAVKLYCVGDDWQSIFRFAGSDLALYEKFDDYFGVTHYSHIDHTYRIGNPILKTTSEFMMKNPNLKKKKLKSTEGLNTEYEIIEYLSDEEEAYKVSELIEKIFEKNKNIKPQDVFIVGRYNFDINVLVNSRTRNFKLDGGENETLITYTSTTGNKFEATFKTAHKVKGKESKYSIILNCNSGTSGFPSQKSDDPFLNLMLSEQDHYENGEERRLFYVALTRASKKTFILTNKRKKSVFICEVENQTGASKNKCPRCIEGDIVIRENKANGNTFYGCSNYPWCDYKNQYKL